ncbi:MAG: glutamine--fructose-6-phosphate transaminase (isomerizing) [Methanomicrobiales archaeon]
MCGIVGYSGRRAAAPILIEGLKRLEYRGYDSFGIATLDSSLATYRTAGRIAPHEHRAATLPGHAGIGHTRWATHGGPDDRNAHPHADCTGRITVVHNGIIENFLELRRELEDRGHLFRSETDTEVIVHLIEEAFDGNLADAISTVIPRLEGSWAILALADADDTLVAARQSSPLVLGVGDGECFAASDMTPLLAHTGRIVFLEDGDLAVISPTSIRILNRGVPVDRPCEEVSWAVEDTRLGGYPHYMLKEIYEQPQVWFETFKSPLPLPFIEALCGSEEITITACGSSYHSALIFKYFAESRCRIPVRVELASEYKYFPAPLRGPVMGISQSGETADTLAALKNAQAHGRPVLAVTNVQGSSITRLADSTHLMRAGPEVSVAATKSFIAQLAAQYAILHQLCEDGIAAEVSRAHLALADVLLCDLSGAIDLCIGAEHMFFVGRGPFYPVCLEGALKMKEITYIHAEGYAAGELKHGPFAMLTPETPVVAVCMPGETHRVMVSNIKEMKARGAPVIAFGAHGDEDLPAIADLFVPVPGETPLVQVLSVTVALQLLAYRTAEALGRDIDRPRNLAKSVTVE